MKRTAIYPGTFDPITNGHLDVINRATKMFDTVVVAIAASDEKRPMFDLKKREALAKLATQDIENVKVVTFNNLLVDFAQKTNIKIVIRGLRAVSDFEYELQMGYANASLDPTLETIYLMPSLQHAFISSSVVRAILKHNGNVSHLVPKSVLPYLDKDSNVYTI